MLPLVFGFILMSSLLGHTPFRRRRKGPVSMQTQQQRLTDNKKPGPCNVAFRLRCWAGAGLLRRGGAQYIAFEGTPRDGPDATGTSGERSATRAAYTVWTVCSRSLCFRWRFCVVCLIR